MTTDTPTAEESRSSTQMLRMRFLVRETMGLVITGAALFISAGRLDWLEGWAVISVMAAWVTGMAYILIVRSPELLAERLGPRKGTKSWDTVIMSIVGLLTLAKLVVAGLDERWGWSSGITPPAQITALVLVALGYGLVVWATAANAYFSLNVRIQEERRHTVATGGPYRFVRHPAYVGSILYELFTPVLLGSWWALALGGTSALLFIVRTALEDRALHKELSGYEEYARQTRYRLLPGVW
ncbi:MAG: isoprenylcysteine carboxylmethyltransferase family protein [Anaerolineae bacterium]|nr:isoprenylcysteine carboxylmethyltransferase family protein [Anaerolineae bacterium]